MSGSQKLFIFAEPRSGSSWLMETLNSHKDISLSSELYNHAMFQEVSNFHRIKKDEFDNCINYLEKKLTPGNKYTGCKILFNQLGLIADDFPAYFIENYKDAYFICLYRENIVEANVSLEIAHAYKTWHVKNNKNIIKRKIYLNPDEFYLKLEITRRRRNKYLHLINNFDVKKIELTYEEMFADQDKKIEEICDFLNISPVYITFSDERKGNPFRVEEIVENFEEVKNYLKRYPNYYEMLIQYSQNRRELEFNQKKQGGTIPQRMKTNKFTLLKK